VGHPEVLVQMANKQTTGEGTDTTTLPGDLTYVLGPNNMPVHFAVKQGDASFLQLILFLAGSTVDKPVKFGEVIPWSWSDGQLAFTGATQIVGVSAEKKQLKAAIKQKMTFGGQEIGTFSLMSTYDIATGALVESVGEFASGTTKQGVKFVRK
jgi:hypothetical protein